MTDRDRLIEVMARATLKRRYGESASNDPGWLSSEVEHVVEPAIEAAERAGFRWVAPDDGR